MDYDKLAELTHKMRDALAVAKAHKRKGHEVPEKVQSAITYWGYWICTYSMDIGDDCEY